MQVRINHNSGMEFSFRLTDQNFGMEFSFGMTDRNSGMEFSFPLIRILDMYPQGNQTGCILSVDLKHNFIMMAYSCISLNSI